MVSTPTRTTFTVDVGGAGASSTASGGGSAVLAVYQAGAYYTPTAAMQVMISDVARHVICLGCNPIDQQVLILCLFDGPVRKMHHSGNHFLL